MKTGIFYGAGKFAEENMEQWENNGIVPLCFADGDSKKQGTQINGISVFALSEVLEQYPDADIYVTVGVDALGRVTQFLLDHGVSEDKICYPYPVEKRLGCKFLGTRLQFFG